MTQVHCKLNQMSPKSLVLITHLHAYVFSAVGRISKETFIISFLQSKASDFFGSEILPSELPFCGGVLFRESPTHVSLFWSPLSPIK